MSGKSVSAKGLWLATKRKPPKADPLFDELPDQKKAHTRDPLDYDPTPESATNAFLREECAFIRAHGDTVSEPASGGGHICRALINWGFKVRPGDVVYRSGGMTPFCLGSFFDTTDRPAPAQVTNPPYNQINASQGHGKWLRHSLDIGFGYIGLLLNADWPAARINGLDALLTDHPPSVEYICTWKIDFRGLGAPPQRNSWFVWDTNRPAPVGGGWIRRRLYKDAEDANQSAFDM